MMTFRREERLRGEALIERLFHREGSRSMAAFPLRMVYMKTASDGAGALPQVLISVPKRCLKHAVDRNRVKRQVREAYRRNRYRLVESLGGDGVRGLLIAFIWLDDKLWSTAEVERKVCNLLQRLSEKRGTDEAFAAYAVKGGGLAALPSNPFLPEVHITFHPAVVPVHPDLFRICQAGVAETRPVQGTCLGHMAHIALQSVGRQRL